MVRQLEPYRSARLLLAYGGPIRGVAARCHVIDAQRDDVTAAELAVNGQVEERSRLRSAICSFVRMDQTWLGRSGGFAPTSLPLFQGTRRAGLRFSIPKLPSCSEQTGRRESLSRKQREMV